MHPITTGRLAYNLPSRQSESSFPERHICSEPDEIAHDDHSHIAYPQPGFPKLDFGPGISSFWQQGWLDQNQSIHRPHHQHHHHTSIDRLTSPQNHHAAHDIFASSPIRPSHHDADWEILRATTLPAPDFPWLPLPQHPSPKIKTEDDSDSNWSLNDNSSEDLQLPKLIRPHIQSLRRRTVGAHGSRVSKVSRMPPTPTSYQHTFRMSSTSGSGNKTSSAAAAGATATTAIETIDLCGTPGPAAGESPDDFAAKMMERRIAHKLSEKSRRNRLTAAIREIQKLMPLDSTEAASGGDATGVYPHFSKVDVAEMAIGYIRRLKRENEELKKKAKAAAAVAVAKEKDGEEAGEGEKS